MAVAMWGTMLASSAACRSYASLLAFRFLLGAAEASVVLNQVIDTVERAPIMNEHSGDVERSEAIQSTHSVAILYRKVP